MCVLNLRNKIQKIERRSQRKRARSQLKVPMDETIRRSLGDVSPEENLCILRVP